MQASPYLEIYSYLGSNCSSISSKYNIFAPLYKTYICLIPTFWPNKILASKSWNSAISLVIKNSHFILQRSLIKNIKCCTLLAISSKCTDSITKLMKLKRIYKSRLGTAFL